MLPGGERVLRVAHQVQIQPNPANADAGHRFEKGTAVRGVLVQKSSRDGNASASSPNFLDLHTTTSSHVGPHGSFHTTLNQYKLMQLLWWSRGYASCWRMLTPELHTCIKLQDHERSGRLCMTVTIRLYQVEASLAGAMH